MRSERHAVAMEARLIGASAIMALSAGALAHNPALAAPRSAAAGRRATPLYDPQQLPVQRGQVQQFTLSRAATSTG